MSRRVEAAPLPASSTYRPSPRLGTGARGPCGSVAYAVVAKVSLDPEAIAAHLPRRDPPASSGSPSRSPPACCSGPGAAGAAVEGRRAAHRKEIAVTAGMGAAMVDQPSSSRPAALPTTQVNPFCVPPLTSTGPEQSVLEPVKLTGIDRQHHAGRSAARSSRAVNFVTAVPGCPAVRWQHSQLHACDEM